MATLDLGKIKFTWKNNYSGATAYEKDDVVKYNESVYVCKLASTGNLPTNTTYWDLMMQGVNILTTLGDLVTHNGTTPIRFGIGTSGQVLTATGSGLSWQPAPGWVGNTGLINNSLYRSSYAHAPKDLIGTGNEPWLGDPATNNLRIATSLANPRLGPRWSSRRVGYSRHLVSAFLNDRYEYVARGTTEYGLVGKYAHTHNHANLTSFMAFSGEYGLLRAGDHFVQVHLVGGTGGAMALTKDGDVFFMGYNAQGLAGAGHTTDVYGWTKVPYLGPDASVSGLSCKIIGLWVSQELNGGEGDLCTAFAIDSSYRLWTWGYNGNGECGIGNTTSPQTTPQLVSALPNVRMLHARPRMVMAVNNLGQLYTWGWNNQGQLGTGNTTAYTSPQLISGATNVYDVEVHSGSYYSGGWNYYGCSYYMKNNGELYGSGYNPYGNLGNGNTTNQSAYVRCGTQTFGEFHVNGDAQYVTVAAIEGNPDTFSPSPHGGPALTAAGNLYCWGYNGNGQFGNGTTTNSSTPTQPGAICDTTRNRTFTYINAVTTNSDRVFPRNLITRIFPYIYSEAGTGWIVQDSLGRMYQLGYGVNMATYRTDNTTIAYSRPVLLPGPWSSEDGHTSTVAQNIIDYRASGYPYGSSFNLQFLMSDGRILHMGTNSEGEFSSDTGFNGRWMTMNP
jgi:Regulator of chromosome condensation (RCC1) repeat